MTPQKDETPKHLHTWGLYLLAPRPGLEPGTYGLTVRDTPISIARKLKICNDFSPANFTFPVLPNR